MMIRIFIFVLISFIYSCKKKELPVPKHSSGNLQKAVIPLTSSYKYQTFFSLQENKIVYSQLKTTWDIAFSCKDKNIFLNSSKLMYAYLTNSTQWKSVTDTIGFEKNKTFDSPTGNTDSTAIGKWWNHPNHIYIISCGYDENGNFQGFIKFKVLNYTSSSFEIAVSNVNDTTYFQYTIPLDTNYNVIGFSYSQKTVLSIEPPKKTWDLQFSQYTEKLTQPYLVVGTILNRYQTFALKLSNSNFDNTTYSDAIKFNLSNSLNTIGYDWKVYDFSSSSYVIKPNLFYIIKDQKGYYYKLRFVDFYSSGGEKGYPTFEFQRL